ncbi:FHA domain-containing protein [Streptomyces sp. H27-D2]|uniref:FHA domain-containing protein n=1 Tax=Streptomyces sp. H27-D2 TaxID=3046304 RepID=UPI002DB95CD4|nr:FHA domain-containing protein [Streptomyces sp. H27-D2]MEC4019872.1 FHA domain-containing protein [Streptomyces sp. H27-D2]
MSDGCGRSLDVRIGRCVQRGFVLPHGRVCFGQGESPVKLFGKLFGKSARQDAGSGNARHRAARGADGTGSGEDRPLFRDEVAAPGGDNTGGYGAAPVDPAGSGRIGSGEPSTSSAGGGFASDPHASNAPAGQPRQEDHSMTALPVCTRCGHRNAEASRFCSNCGAPLRAGAQPERPSETTSTISISGLEAYEAEATGQPLPSLSPEAQAAVDALPPGSALLVVRRGPNSGSRFLLDGELTTAGRHPQGDIFLDDVTVSRRHVEFRRGADGGFTVSDVGSLNGTYVNRERIDAVALTNGDEVQIGKYRLVFYASQRGI